MFSYAFYAIAIRLVMISLSQALGFLISSSMPGNTSPYLYSVYLLTPVLAYSLFVNSGVPKNDNQRVNMFIFSVTLLMVLIGEMACDWISNGVVLALK